ncbi:hypothetical protein GCM10022393_05200 [Aquimarina addita]|uniref:Antitoxin component YwqK of YwqJK toxin-antitoxin module n=1 Tax=Aquimarina addita TaxID=870485 RepID=A0ABP7XCD9_9FLAO
MNYIYKGSTIVLMLFMQWLCAQEHILKDDTETQILSLYIDTDTTKTRSNMGFIRQTFENKHPEKIAIDTCFFNKEIGLDKEFYHQHKMRIEKTIDKQSKHYLIYNSNDLNKIKYKENYNQHLDKKLSISSTYKRYHYFPKTSIPLEGYFEMYDDSKPYNEITYEPTVYDEPTSKDWCGTPLMSRRYKSLRNAGGLFSEGLRNGKWVVFVDYRFAKTEEHYSKGIRDGLYIVYNKNNKILYQTKFIKGTGEERTYRKDGSIHTIKFYKNGKIDYSQPITHFYSNGQTAILYDYPNNIIKRFYKNGVIFSTQQTLQTNNHYVSHGTYKDYNRAGHLKSQKYYEYNRLINFITYDDKGRIETINSGNMTQHFKRGKLKKIQLYNDFKGQHQIINF